MDYLVRDPSDENEEKLCGRTNDEFTRLKAENLDEYKEVTRKGIITTDIEDIMVSDLMMVYYDESCFRGAGTVSECMIAYLVGVPVIMVTSIETTSISGWLLGEVSRQFDNFEDLLTFLGNKRFVDDIIARCKLAASLDPMAGSVHDRLAKLFNNEVTDNGDRTSRSCDCGTCGDTSAKAV